MRLQHKERAVQGLLKDHFTYIPGSNTGSESLGKNLRGGQVGLTPNLCVLCSNVQVLYEIGQKADTILNISEFQWLFLSLSGC